MIGFEDIDTVRRTPGLLEFSLKTGGYRVISASSGREAQENNERIGE